MRPTLLVVVVAASRLSSSPAAGFSPASLSTSLSLRSLSSSHRGGGVVVAQRPLLPSPPSTPSRMLPATTEDLAKSVLKNPKYPPEWPYSPVDFERQDESNDSIFYSQPCLVYHIDEYAISNLKDRDDVLDVCSSWVSHYPVGWKGGNVVGLGMKEYELSKNKSLSSYDMRDLNKDPTFLYPDNNFDTVTCMLSIDYLNKPRDASSEAHRVLFGGEKSLQNKNFGNHITTI